MKYVLWVLGPLLFLFFVTLALKNTDLVAVRYFLGYEWRAPLIFVLFVSFCLGVVFGVLAAFGTIVRKGRENARLKHELRRRDDTLREPPREPFPPDVAGL
jgi:uncharacterized integral membrane protein